MLPFFRPISPGDQINSIQNAVGIDVHFSDFLNRTGMEDEICHAISKATTPNWETVARKLSAQEPFKLIFMGPDIFVIKKENRVQDQSKAFIREFVKTPKATVRAFVIALHSAHPIFDTLCKKICEKAGDLGFYNELEKYFPVAAQSIQRPLPDSRIVDQMQVAQEALRKENEQLKRRLAELQPKPMPEQENLLEELKKLKRDKIQLEQKLEEQSEKTVCSICSDKTISKIAQCGHVYCDVCIQKIHTCAICRLQIVEVRPFFFN